MWVVISALMTRQITSSLALFATNFTSKKYSFQMGLNVTFVVRGKRIDLTFLRKVLTAQ